MTRYVDFPTATGDIVFSGSPSDQRCRRLLASEALAAFKKRQNSLIPGLILKKNAIFAGSCFWWLASKNIEISGKHWTRWHDRPQSRVPKFNLCQASEWRQLKNGLISVRGVMRDSYCCLPNLHYHQREKDLSVASWLSHDWYFNHFESGKQERTIICLWPNALRGLHDLT